MPSMPELETIRDYLRYATSRFNEAGLYYGHGTDNAWDEAIALIFHTLHLPHDIHPAVLDAKLTAEERKTLDTLLEKRLNQRIPVPYLTHQAWFAGMRFYVDERVIIPRSPIAELIEGHFRPWISTHHVHRILDLCTGSGCIAIACAKAFPDATVDATDISADALAVAKINVARHEVDETVHLYTADFYDGLPDGKYDIIVSNPPYVAKDEMDTLPKEYTHEPVLALASGEYGLDAVGRILKDAAARLNPHGILVVEVGNSEHALQQAFSNFPFTWLDFERSDGGVFLLTADQLKECRV